MKKPKPTGTREWSSYSANLPGLIGCEHNCKYCYARANALRFNEIKDREEWPLMRFKKTPAGTFYKFTYRKVDGTIMFPTKHDITPKVLESAIQFIKGALEQGNKLLIVSKPHLDCMNQIYNICRDHKNQVLFRFTIGNTDNHVLKFWEPGAPSFEERKACLHEAFAQGFKTSVSVEPMLGGGMLELYQALIPYITDSIWFGKMNRIDQRVDTKDWGTLAQTYLQLVRDVQQESYIKELYFYLKDDPRVRWKDSIKKVLGIEAPKEIGMDI